MNTLLELDLLFFATIPLAFILGIIFPVKWVSRKSFVILASVFLLCWITLGLILFFSQVFNLINSHMKFDYSDPKIIVNHSFLGSLALFCYWGFPFLLGTVARKIARLISSKVH